MESIFIYFCKSEDCMASIVIFSNFYHFLTAKSESFFIPFDSRLIINL